MDMAEDVVFRPGAGHSEEELLATQVPVQVGVRWAVGYEEINIRRDSDRSLQIRPCRDAVEFDALELYPFILQIDNSAGNQIPRSCRLLVEDAVVVARNEDSEFSGNGYVPGEDVLQVGRIETFTSISGTDEDVSLGWYSKPPIHPVCVGECEDLMSLVVDEHQFCRIESRRG